MPRSEKSMFVALKEARATDEQRLAIMAAYDETQPRLRDLAEESAGLIAEWHALDRTEKDFEARADALAKRWGEIARERMTVTAKFDAKVGAVFDSGQWRDWTLYWNRPAYGAGMVPPEQEGRRRY